MRKESFQGILLGIVIMCAVFAFITVAWAALSSTLTVNGYATVAAQTWNIGFGTAKNALLDATGTAISTCSTTGGGVCPTGEGADTLPTITKNTFGQTTTPEAQNLGSFTTAGTIKYTWYIVNLGTFDAYITSVPSITLTCTEETTTDTYTTTTAATNFCSALSATLKVGTSTTSTDAENVAPAVLDAKINKSGASSPLVNYVKAQLEIVYSGEHTEGQALPDGKVKVSLPSAGVTITYGQNPTT